MRGRDRRHPTEAVGRIVETALLACVLAALLASSVALVAAARTIDIAPKVGDVLVFKPTMRVPADWEFAAVTTSDQLPVSCNLRPDSMASGGGSLVVEQRFAGSRMYRVHWAGQRTSSDTADCGNAADLLVSRGDLQLLTNAVGGAGVEHHAFGDF
jgi:hypothetical protein